LSLPKSGRINQAVESAINSRLHDARMPLLSHARLNVTDQPHTLDWTVDQRHGHVASPSIPRTRFRSAEHALHRSVGLTDTH